MSTQVSQAITQILNQGVESKDSLNKVFELMYPEIKRIARSQLLRLNSGQTITPTVLVNECYLKLSKPSQLSFENRQHFIHTAARCMRQFLVDRIRNNQRQKRSGEKVSEGLTQIIGSEDINFQLLELDETLSALEKIDEDLAKLVELKFFSGHSLIEIAEIYGVSKRTIIRRWNVAKSFMSALNVDNKNAE